MARKRRMKSNVFVKPNGQSKFTCILPWREKVHEMTHSMSSSVEGSVMDVERRGAHTQATGIIQLLNKEEDMMKEAYAQSIECEEPCEGRL